MKYLLFIPFFLQALIIFIDEFYFHIKRGLPKWEKIGHPLDTLSILILFVFCYMKPFSTHNLKTFIFLGLFSSLFVTKDEWIHKDSCEKKEMWLHALLFIHHPIVIASLGFLWADLYGNSFIDFSISKTLISQFILSQIILIFGFMSYQIIYWNFLCPKKQKV